MEYNFKDKINFDLLTFNRANHITHHLTLRKNKGFNKYFKKKIFNY